jgi:excisionase family DNA binding protein
MDKYEKQKSEPFLTPKEVAQLLRCNLKTIYNHTKKGLLNRYSFGGRRIYYKRSEVESAIIPLK